MPNLPATPVMTYADVAAWTGITKDALRRLAHEGRMPAPDGRAGESHYWMDITIVCWAPGGRVAKNARSRSD